MRSTNAVASAIANRRPAAILVCGAAPPCDRHTLPPLIADFLHRLPDLAERYSALRGFRLNRHSWVRTVCFVHGSEAIIHLENLFDNAFPDFRPGFPVLPVPAFIRTSLGGLLEIRYGPHDDVPPTVFRLRIRLSLIS